MMQQPTQGPAGSVVYVRVDKKVKSGSFAKKSVKGFSIAQISLGAASIFCQFLIIIISSTYSHVYYDNLAGIGEGIYCGVFYVIAGILGLFANRNPSRCNITAFMILSIVAAVFSFIHIIISSINLHGIIIAGECNCGESSLLEPNSARLTPGPEGDSEWSWSRRSEPGLGRGGNQVLLVAMILSGLAEGIIAVICSALCCRACCCTGAEVYLTQGPGLEEGGPAQVPVQLGLQPVPAIQTFNQQISQPPAYGEVVLEARQKSEKGDFMRL